MKELVLGAARSGKSRYAEEQVEALGKKKIYIATGEGGDSEMLERIAHHQARRNESWFLVEEPLNLAKAILDHDSEKNAILVDCLTLWLSNCLHKNVYKEEKIRLLEVLNDLKADIIFVGNEVGAGIVPMGELSREFVDQNGWLHQDLAKACDHLSTVVAGIPLKIK